ncbi:MAG: hypothetical protein ACODAQ_02800 [Phycisphaeraceae bacterium]
MPKQDTSQGKKLAALLKKLAKAHAVEEPPPRDPTLQLVVSFLQWEATRKQAEQAIGRLMEHMVDVNDLRVSFEQEILELLGEDYPRASERVARMREALNDIYVREHTIEMRSIAEKGKKEQRAYLDSLPGITPYVAAQVTLLCFGGHAMPVDQKLIERLAEEGIIPESDTDPQHVENVLLRLVRAEEALEAHLLLQTWADDRATRRRAAKKAASRKTTSRSRSATTTRSRTSRTTKKTARRSRKK